MSITARRLTPPHCVHGSAPRLTPSKAQWSMSYPSDTRLSLNKRLLLPNSISPMARSRLRARLPPLVSPSLYFFSPLDRSDRDSFISLKEFDGNLRTEPGHWPRRGQREGEGHGESAPAYRTPCRAGARRGSGYVREPAGILLGRDPPYPAPLSMDRLYRVRSSSGSSVGKIFSTIRR